MMRFLVTICLLVCLNIPAYAITEKICEFQGGLDFIDRIFQLKIDFGKDENADINLSFLSKDVFRISTKINHLTINNFDLLTDLEIKGKFIRDQEGNLALKGWAKTNYSLINHKPFKELIGSFEISKSRLNIPYFFWGNFKLSGNIELVAPYNLDLNLEIVNIGLDELASFLGITRDDVYLDGWVNGNVNVSGSLERPKIKAHLEAIDGEIEGLKYNNIFANIKGIFPVLSFVDSYIATIDTVYDLEGKFNIKELSNLESPEHDVMLVSSGNTDFSWNQWTIHRKEDIGYDDTLEFEYKLKPDKPFRMRLREDEEILGLEHTTKF